jgi:adenosylhomocysteine nucleosidase
VKRLGVLVAVRPEAAAILADERYRWADRGGGIRESGAFPISLALTGVGKAFAAWACARLAPDCDLMLSLGTSGGLSSEEVGSLWLVDEFVEHDLVAPAPRLEAGVAPFADMAGPVMRTAGAATLALAERACAAAGLAVSRCRSASGDCFVADPELARELGRRTGARLCDMESAAEAKLCLHRAGVEFLALRAVSDNAGHRARKSWAEQVELSGRDLAAFLWEFARIQA